MKRWWVVVALLVLLTGACSKDGDEAASFRSAGVESAPEMGRPAPDVGFVSLGGEKLRLSDYAGKPVFLNLFATWCPPCRAEMPSMQKLYERAAGDGLVMLAVSAEDRDVVEKFVRDNGFTFTVGVDPDRSVMDAYRVRAIPATFLIDRHGTIVYQHVGYLDWTSDEATRQINALLGK